jgi:hypothetical protein
MSDVESVVARVKRRSVVLAAAGIAAAFFVGAAAGASLTICAAVVISSFLALEKIVGRLAPAPGKSGWRKLVPLLMVTLGSFVLLGVVLWRWKGFDPVAGAAGVSVVVLGIVPEVWRR